MGKESSYRSEYGWVDREGNYYPCNFGQHNAKALELIRSYGLIEELQAYEVQLNRYPILSDWVCDFLVEKKGWGMRHNPSLTGKPYLRCQRPNELMLRREEDIAFYFRYIA